MCYLKFSWTVFVLLALVTLVSGSCLEFGHSCWGAHGKRSSGRASIAAKQQVAPYVDNLAEQLFNSKDNNNNIDEDTGSNNNNSDNNNLAQTAPNSEAAAAAAAAAAAERARAVNGAKWAQLLRQQRQQLRQLQRQFDASDAAESWRRLQQALAEAEQQRQQQQQQQLPIGDFLEK